MKSNIAPKPHIFLNALYQIGIRITQMSIYLCISELPCFSRVIIMGLIEDLVHLDSAPCYSLIILYNLREIS